MIVKNREIPKINLLLEAIDRRLPQDHPQKLRIEKDLIRRRKGFNGEKSFNYYLESLSDDYHILNDVRLPSGKFHFQMDTLILCPSFILIIDVKNYGGEVFLDQHAHQLIRKYKDQEEVFPDPITQIENQQRKLRKWLEKEKYPPIPLEYLVIFTNPSTKLSTNPGKHHIFQKVCHANRFEKKLEQIEVKHKEEVLEKKSLRKLARLLISRHTPAAKDILDHYNLSKSDILSGVQCPSCKTLPMHYTNRNWHCPHCAHTSKNAHEEAIIDYLLLINRCLHNQDLRNFLHLSSRHVTKRMVKAMNLDHSGNTKARTYYFT